MRVMAPAQQRADCARPRRSALADRLCPVVPRRLRDAMRLQARSGFVQDATASAPEQSRRRRRQRPIAMLQPDKPGHADPVPPRHRNRAGSGGSRHILRNRGATYLGRWHRGPRLPAPGHHATARRRTNPETAHFFSRRGSGCHNSVPVCNKTATPACWSQRRRSRLAALLLREAHRAPRAEGLVYRARGRGPPGENPATAWSTTDPEMAPRFPGRSGPRWSPAGHAD